MIVRDVPDIELVRAGIRHHHERWDGDGYLDRLAGRGHPADRPDPRRRRRVLGDDDDAAVPQGARSARGADAARGCGRARSSTRTSSGVHRGDRDRRRRAAARAPTSRPWPSGPRGASRDSDRATALATWFRPRRRVRSRRHARTRIVGAAGRRPEPAADRGSRHLLHEARPDVDRAARRASWGTTWICWGARQRSSPPARPTGR